MGSQMSTSPSPISQSQGHIANSTNTTTADTPADMAPTLKRTRDDRDDQPQPPTKKNCVEKVGKASSTLSASPSTPSLQRKVKGPERELHPLPPRPPQVQKQVGGEKPSTAAKTSTSSKKLKRKREDQPEEAPSTRSGKKQRLEQPADTSMNSPTTASTLASSIDTKSESSESAQGAVAASLPQQPKKKLEFMGLPPEMRNKIYNLALPTPSEKSKAIEPSLLRVCKQVRSEARGLYLSQPFEFTSLQVASDFLKHLTKDDRAFLQNIEVKAPSPAQVHTLRRVRRALMAWDKAYGGKKGNLKAGVVRIPMPVTNKLGTPQQSDELVWCYVKRNSSEELEGDLKKAQQEDKAKKAKDIQDAQDQALYQARYQTTDQTEDQAADQTTDQVEQAEIDPRIQARKDPRTGAEDIRPFETKRTMRSGIFTFRQPLPIRKKNIKKNV